MFEIKKRVFNLLFKYITKKCDIAIKHLCIFIIIMDIKILKMCLEVIIFTVLFIYRHCFDLMTSENILLKCISLFPFLIMHHCWRYFLKWDCRLNNRLRIPPGLCFWSLDRITVIWLIRDFFFFFFWLACVPCIIKWHPMFYSQDNWDDDEEEEEKKIEAKKTGMNLIVASLMNILYSKLLLSKMFFCFWKFKCLLIPLL